MDVVIRENTCSPIFHLWWIYSYYVYSLIFSSQEDTNTLGLDTNNYYLLIVPRSDANTIEIHDSASDRES